MLVNVSSMNAEQNANLHLTIGHTTLQIWIVLQSMHRTTRHKATRSGTSPGSPPIMLIFNFGAGVRVWHCEFAAFLIKRCQVLGALTAGDRPATRSLSELPAKA